MTELDLFGKRVRNKRSRLQIRLAKSDRDTLPERAQRLKFLRQTVPKRMTLFGSMEHVFTFNEAQATFINGQYIATILLAQAFVERLLQSQMTSKGYPGAKRGLKYILQYCIEHDLLPLPALRKVEQLRRIRNPFAHLKPYEYPYNLSQRVFQHLKDFHTPEQLLFEDAKLAIVIIVMMLSLKMR